MRAARLENNLVVDLWEVPSLTCYGDLYTLVEAPDFVSIGDVQINGVFVDSRPKLEVVAPTAPTKEQLMIELAALTSKINSMG